MRKIKRIDYNKYKKTKYEWTEWKSPDDILSIEEIPDGAGIYQLGCKDENGQIVNILPLIEIHKQRSANITSIEIQGLSMTIDDLRKSLYIGRTIDLRERYWNLIKSWKTELKIKNIHNSREHYESNNEKFKKVHEKYPISKIVCRCKLIVPGTIKQSQHGNKQTSINELKYNEISLKSNTSIDYSQFFEAHFIRICNQYFGQRPPLNVKNEGTKDKLANETFVKKVISGLQ